MFDKRRQRGVGLDVGAASAKLVILEGTGAKVRMVGHAVLDLQAEGILGEEELAEHLGPWLREHGYRDEDLVVNLPQWMVMAHLADFPPTESSRLEEMVGYEVQQLAGLSDESFIDGYRQYQPVSGFRNPVLVGVCRENLVNRRLEVIGSAGVQVTDLAMDGEALVAAIRRLVPEVNQKDDLRLILDLGTDNTNMVLIHQAQVLFAGTIMGGGQYFTESIARHLGVSESEAEKTKRSGTIVPGDSNNPMTRSMTNLLNEVRTAMENWRHQSLPDGAAEPTLAAIYLTGATSQIGGLSESLGSTFGCPVSTLAVPDVADPLVALRLTEAYGLALQALSGEKRNEMISFAPERLTWRLRRERRAPLLGVSIFMLGLLLAGHIFTSRHLNQRQIEQANAEQARLQQCSRLAPEVNTELDQISLMRHMMVPFASLGNRNRQVVETVTTLSQVKSDRDWFYLVADEATYYEQTRFGASGGTANASIPFRRGTVVGAGGGPERFANLQELKPWSDLYVSGFTPERSVNPLGTVSATIATLNEQPEGMFTNVDIMASGQISPLDYSLRLPWRQFLQMRPFTLNMPLREQPFALEDME